jgi:maleate isomerase
MAEDWYRVGLVLTSTNTTMERDCWRNLPPAVTVHTTRLHLPGGQVWDLEQVVDVGIPQAVRQLSALQPHAVVLGITILSALRGNETEERVCADLTGEIGAPVTSAMLESRRALHALGARRVACVSPYPAALNERVRASLVADGFEVVAFAGMGIESGFGLCAVTPAELVAFAQAELRDVAADALLCVSTALRALEALPRLRRLFPIPVVTTNQAALSACRRLLLLD